MKIFITGTAGFIGFHLAKLLLAKGFEVHGYDGMTNYYDVNLKKKRHSILVNNSNFTSTSGMLEDYDKLNKVADNFKPDIIIHLAAQAGVRYSLEKPRSYIDSNIVGSFNVMEVARIQKVKHFLIASSSSVYGANADMPFKEIEKTDTQVSLYAATKKAIESIAHSYAHLWKIPTTLFRFFTVYGPWGRPDMALFQFVDKILKNKPIDIYNHGDMYRDFTYIDDLVNSIKILIDTIPGSHSGINVFKNDSISPVAPYRIINIGNSKQVKLIDFVNTIEKIIGKKAVRNFLPMQKGDIYSSWADCTLLKNLTGNIPETNFEEGVSNYIKWYREYYNI